MPYLNLDTEPKPKAKFCVVFDTRERDLISKLKEPQMRGILSDQRITFGRNALKAGDIMIGRLPKSRGELVHQICIIERKEFKDLVATIVDKDRSSNLSELRLAANARGITTVLMLEKMYKFMGSIRIDKNGHPKVPPKKYRSQVPPSTIIGLICNASMEMGIWFTGDVSNSLLRIYNYIINKMHKREKPFEYAPRNPTDFIFAENGIEEVVRGGGAAANVTYTAGLQVLNMGEKKRQAPKIEDTTLTEMQCYPVGIVRTVKIFMSMKDGHPTTNHFAHHPPIDSCYIDPALEEATTTINGKQVVMRTMQLCPLTSSTSVFNIVDMVCRLLKSGCPTWLISYEHLWTTTTGKIITLTSFAPEDINDGLSSMLTCTSDKLFKDDKTATLYNMIGLCIAHELNGFDVDVRHLELMFPYTKLEMTQQFHIGQLFITIPRDDFVQMLKNKFEIFVDEDLLLKSLQLIDEILRVAEFGK